jgi:flagellar hook-associated protein 1
MADILSTGVSGLLAFRRALDTTGHNISNVGTEGYSRQRTELLTQDPSSYGFGWIGNGVSVATVRRNYDDLLTRQVRSSATTLGELETFASKTERLSNLFGNSQNGLSASLQKFANALQEVANSPAAIAPRQVLMSEAKVLTDRLKALDSQLLEYGNEIETQLQSEVREVSALASNIARLNGEIASGIARTGQPPNDLLDQRDRLIDDLAQYVEVSTVPQQDGRVNVLIGNGQSLVLGDIAAEMLVLRDPFDPSRSGIGLRTGTGPQLDVTSSIGSGSLGGALSFRSEILDDTRSMLGRISLGLSETINTQHNAGIDLSGQLGADVFAVGGVRALPHADNPSGTTITVARTTATEITGSDYILRRSGGIWELQRLDTGTSVPLNGTGSSGDPLTADGLEILVSGTPQDGDRYLIRPTQEATSGLQFLLTDPAQIAAAAPIRTSATSTNTGNATISAGEVLDASNSQLRSTVTLSFLSSTTYSVNGGPPQTYSSGGNIDVNGWRVTINGTPATGDSFVISDNINGTGDNRNALALNDSLKRPLLDNGTVSLDAAAAQLVGSIGVATRQAQTNRDAQQVVQRDNLAARDSISGVNLDEEAANMLRYQQAYQAAAQVIRVASTLFDSLLSATRR